MSLANEDHQTKYQLDNMEDSCRLTFVGRLSNVRRTIVQRTSDDISLRIIEYIE